MEELESRAKVGLITIEEKSSTVLRLSRRILCCCHLRSKLNPATENSMGCDRNRRGRGRRNFKVVSRIGFPDVRSKWTFQRGSYLARKFEVISPVQQVQIVSVSLGCSQDDVYIYLFGSAPKAGSSWNGVMSIGAPLFQRPTIRAPRRSLPSAGVKTFPFPSTGMGFLFKKTLNSGTVWKR